MGSFLEVADKIASIVGATAGVAALAVALVALKRQSEPSPHREESSSWAFSIPPEAKAMGTSAVAVLLSVATLPLFLGLWILDIEYTAFEKAVRIGLVVLFGFFGSVAGAIRAEAAEVAGNKKVQEAWGAFSGAIGTLTLLVIISLVIQLLEFLLSWVL